MIRALIIVLLINTTVCFSSCNNKKTDNDFQSSKRDFEVYDKKKGIISIKGHKLILQNAKGIMNEYEDISSFINIVDSKTKKYSVVIIGKRQEYDFWLLNNSDKVATKIKMQEKGNHLIDVRWYDDSFFGFEWGGMGYKTGIYASVDSPNKFIEIDNPIYFSPDRKLIIFGKYDEKADFEEKKVRQKIVIRRGIKSKIDEKTISVLFNTESFIKYKFIIETINIADDEIYISFLSGDKISVGLE